MKTEMDEMTLVKLASKYSDNDNARALLESIRWPNGPVCPKCGSKEAYRLTAKPTSKSPARPGLCKCKACRKQFTVTVGTIFEDSHIKISTWLMAIFILCSSKKGVSAHQLHRMLGVTYKTAWFMAHRIRFAMSEGPLAEMLSGVVEIDETYVGGKPRPGFYVCSVPTFSWYFRDSRKREKERFDQFVQQWKQETDHYSIVALRYAHRAYISIFTFKENVVGWILEELKTDPDWWFDALTILTGHDAAQSARGFREAVLAWLEWGRNNGYDV